jgi:hypothetical protein
LQGPHDTGGGGHDPISAAGEFRPPERIQFGTPPEHADGIEGDGGHSVGVGHLFFETVHQGMPHVNITRERVRAKDDRGHEGGEARLAAPTLESQKIRASQMRPAGISRKPTIFWRVRTGLMGGGAKEKRKGSDRRVCKNELPVGPNGRKRKNIP